MNNKIKKLVQDHLEEVIKHRRYFHKNPELGFQEFKTTQYIIDELKKAGITNVKYALKRTNTGVYFDIDSNKPGKTILFRADIDALPVNEDSDLEYKSIVENVAHMCGHDGHTASLIGVAKIINQLKGDFKGKIRFLFQPAEEGPDLGGAIEIVNENEVLKDVDYVLGLHLYGEGEFNKLYFKHGPMYASFIDWELKIKSIGGHCSEPHKSPDPILIGSNAVNLFQTILTKIKSPLDNAIIAVGTFNSGTNANVIPSTATLTGTIRTYDLELGRKIVDSMKKIMKGLTDLYGGSYEFSFLEGYPPLINDNYVTDQLIDISKLMFNESDIREINKPSFGCEDFSYFTNKVPGAYFKVGIHKENESEPLHHSSSFCWDDAVLETTMKATINIIINFLNRI